MPIVQVPALKALLYQGHSYVRGELITCEAAEALMLARRGDVTLTRGAVLNALDTDGLLQSSDMREIVSRELSRTLETRDLTAEAPETPETPPMRRRRYQRRDLTAEE